MDGSLWLQASCNDLPGDWRIELRNPFRGRTQRLMAAILAWRVSAPNGWAICDHARRSISEAFVHRKLSTVLESPDQICNNRS